LGHVQRRETKQSGESQCNRQKFWDMCSSTPEGDREKIENPKLKIEKLKKSKKSKIGELLILHKEGGKLGNAATPLRLAQKP
jgi:hypothetical protein